MNKKLYIFDVDGTLVETRSGGTFRTSADDWQWKENRIEKILKLGADGSKIAIATNQAGVAFEWSSFSAAEMQDELERMGADIKADHIAVCYNSPNPKALREYFHKDDPRRKPNPGMLLEILDGLGIAPADALMIGDRDEDKLAAKAAGVEFQMADIFFAQTDDLRRSVAARLSQAAMSYDEAGRVAFFERLLALMPEKLTMIEFGLDMGGSGF